MNVGADMILYVISESEKDKDHAGLKACANFVQKMKQKQFLGLVDEVDEAMGGHLLCDEFLADEETGELSKEQLADLRADFIDRIYELIDRLDARDVGSISHKGDTLYITGGESWGDQPTESSCVFERAQQVLYADALEDVRTEMGVCQ